MKIYTEEVRGCFDCPNKRLGYGSPYCCVTFRDVLVDSGLPEECPLPDKEEA